MTGEPRNAGSPPPEILRRGSGYDAEPPVTLRSQVLRRRPVTPAPNTDTTTTEDFPSTDTEDAAPDTVEDDAGDSTDTAGARRRPRRAPAVSAEARRARREARLARRRAEMDRSTGALAYSAVPDDETPTEQFPADEPAVANAGAAEADSRAHDYRLVLDATYPPAEQPGYADSPATSTDRALSGWSVAEDYDHAPAVAADRTGPVRRVVAQMARHRWLLIVAAALVVAVVALVSIAVMVRGLVGGDSGDGITDPVAAMDTPDPFSDAVECPSTSEGATTTGRDPGNLSSGPKVIKAFNYAYFQWRSGPAARAVTASNVQGIGSPVELQREIDTLNPQARYCLSIEETGANTYRVVVTLIFPDGTRDPDPDVQNITTTQIGERTYIASVTRDKK
ncbi:hypothetical protein ACLTEW_24390 [Gordonia lacunae]|uniref:hypothetical protein n=1 Tax=Gordonia TaxID=2053 RepID=UPI00200ADCC9|nr:hypothetical protein [Gordonia terrae]UPW12007.1 hypothetical protein M1C59_25485 [Gordonia terrae]